MEFKWKLGKKKNYFSFSLLNPMGHCFSRKKPGEESTLDSSLAAHSFAVGSRIDDTFWKNLPLKCLIIYQKEWGLKTERFLNYNSRILKSCLSVFSLTMCYFLLKGNHNTYSRGTSDQWHVHYDLVAKTNLMFLFFSKSDWCIKAKYILKYLKHL